MKKTNISRVHIPLVSQKVGYFKLGYMYRIVCAMVWTEGNLVFPSISKLSPPLKKERVTTHLVGYQKITIFQAHKVFHIFSPRQILYTAIPYPVCPGLRPSSASKSWPVIAAAACIALHIYTRKIEHLNVIQYFRANVQNFSENIGSPYSPIELGNPHIRRRIPLRMGS